MWEIFFFLIVISRSKRDSSPKNINSVIIYSLSRSSSFKSDECLCSAEHKGRCSEECGQQSSSGAPFTSIVFLFPTEQHGYKLSSEYLLLCSAEQRNSYRFGTTWEQMMTEYSFWVNYPFNCKFTLSIFQMYVIDCVVNNSSIYVSFFPCHFLSKCLILMKWHIPDHFTNCDDAFPVLTIWI